MSTIVEGIRRFPLADLDVSDDNVQKAIKIWARHVEEGSRDEKLAKGANLWVTDRDWFVKMLMSFPHEEIWETQEMQCFRAIFRILNKPSQHRILVSIGKKKDLQRIAYYTKEFLIDTEFFEEEEREKMMEELSCCSKRMLQLTRAHFRDYLEFNLELDFVNSIAI
jgi:hypothetical protein